MRKRQEVLIPKEEIARQMELCRQVARRNRERSVQPLALVDTYGCQQNEADSEQIRGMLREMGYGFTEDTREADVIVINTCAIREHAELRVLGNVGALTHTKRRKPEQVICLCGCSMQEPHMADKIRRSFRHVDLVFGPHALWKFPELLDKVLRERERVFATENSDGCIAEGLPVVRKGKIKAWVSIMYGCNNFCTYCIVPYVRGRERSRDPERIVDEVRQLVAEGYQDITLLGQNVNSYGKDLGLEIDFADLLARIDAIPGDFFVRFMTSHPRDASQKLFETMARCPKVAPQLHLPFQSGSSRVLKAMNRHYDRETYLDEVRRLRELIPDVVLTSDVIVGFPGETEAEFEETLSLLEEVRFDSLFTFIFSPRVGTPAAQMEDPTPMAEKKARFQRLLDLQNRISLEKHQAYVGRTLPVLVEEENDADPVNNLNCRTDGWRLVHVPGDPEHVGQRKLVKITGCSTWSLFGAFVEEA
ncbi:MAG: tRNA (N6-isopentenyl adenosine(37)-C2)-methylthiotransferase MiaB [Clostridiales bacterium]|jgi:tRNA-2-methylthio-N6-dimethylallyladenosine synthase|nr:MAG: tRNA (N6-isopentenyl adenosine(37)-C2)-methylthiotransferase MiaB [Clostridiales bacterium]